MDMKTSRNQNYFSLTYKLNRDIMKKYFDNQTNKLLWKGILICHLSHLK